MVLRGLAITLLLTGAIQAQATYDVVSIKLPPKTSPNHEFPRCKGSRFLSENAPVQMVASWAYSARDFQLSDDWPAWTKTLPYRIEASLPKAVSDSGYKEVGRSLLAKEFKLQLRRVQRTMDVYELVAGRVKPGLREIDATASVEGETTWATFCDDGSAYGCFHIGGEIPGVPGIAMSDMVWQLKGLGKLDRPVIDRTGLTGRYAFKLQYDTRPDGVGDDIFSALDRQLGLRLVPRRESIEVFQVAGIERPVNQ